MVLNRVSKIFLGLLFALTASVVLADNQPAGDLTLDKLLSKEFKPGYMALNSDVEMNFFLNRLAWSIPAADLKEVGSRIHSVDDWVPEMIKAAESAEGEGRLMHAANYWKAAEFYMIAGDDKRRAYERFVELHDRAMPDISKVRKNVPYEGGFLPVVELAAKGTQKGTIVIHSGYDGLVEELILPLGPLMKAGYRVIAFEGPGQGGVLRVQDIPMPPEWEKPVGAILDFFDIDDCTLIGMSLGGYLAPRAAAFDSRIKRVVAWGAMHDMLAGPRQDPQFTMLENLVSAGERGKTNGAFRQMSEDNPKLQLSGQHGMHVSGGKDIFEFYQWAMKMTLKDVAHLIKQDVLIVMGTQDHLVPAEQAWISAKAMTNARSMSVRMITAEEQGAEHCQIGNPQLTIEEIIGWLQRLERRDQALKDPLPYLATGS